MKIVENLPKLFVLGFFGIGAGVLIFKAFETEESSESLAITLPSFTSEAQAGEVVFNDNCAACHGSNATGTNNGPPLVHNIYNPGHHDDASFYRAVENGVPRHHWPFGNMPKQSHVTKDEVTSIIRYIRELQLANGISYKPHNM
ncbi:Cytochrome C oxidase, cbb3-type, subunit III [Pseudovibrio denitrificans]|uniref:Cytochrome C oxidase, cbb3-type, subunit III n=1 Tax=Pseudovibrio denitrificans TaxID=258256 RepID=A0A1I6YK53_9HYPH|nr:cytochrome c [Pseudovibrio denitrificans]SFT50873.1 Cytochrome C oxidase, cbb3-type, subunit III [Pseudovibrio denitrificans]